VEANSSSLMNTMMIRALDKIATEIKKLNRGCFMRVRTKDGYHGRIVRKKSANVKISY